MNIFKNRRKTCEGIPPPTLPTTAPSCSYCASSTTWGAGFCNSGDVMLQSTLVKVGIHEEGSFGTSRNTPADSTQQSDCPAAFGDGVYAGKQLGFM